MSIESYPSPNGVLTSLIWRKTAAGGETSLSGYDNASQALSYTPGQEQVYLNGILLVRGSDYTATNGTSITGLTALTADDFVQINCYNNFSVASVPAASLTGTVTNAQLQNSSITINGSATSLGGTYTNASASTSTAGIVQLTDSTSSTSTTTAATPNSVKSAYDLANGAIQKTLTTTTGDIIYASSANTPARLGIGSTSQVLTVSGGVPSWATPASGGGWTSLASGSLSGASVSVNITTTGYYQVIAFVKSAVCNTDWYLAFDLNTDSGSNYSFINQYSSSSTAVTTAGRDATTSFFVDKGLRNGDIGNAVYVINNPANTTAHKMVTGICSGRETGNSYYVNGQFFGRYMSNSAITNIRFINGGSSFTGGTYEIYGVK